MNDPKWYLRYDGMPPADDENDYVWDKILHRWIPCEYEQEYEQSEIDEGALERHERRRRKLIEWETYHPGVPCPECELED